MELFITAAGALALVTALVNFLKYIKAKDTNGWLTMLFVWLAGLVTVFLLSASDFADTFALGDSLTLDTANGASLILAGLGLGSTAMLANDVKKAIDNGDSSKKPPLTGD